MDTSLTKSNISHLSKLVDKRSDKDASTFRFLRGRGYFRVFISSIFQNKDGELEYLYGLEDDDKIDTVSVQNDFGVVLNDLSDSIKKVKHGGGW